MKKWELRYSNGNAKTIKPCTPIAARGMVHCRLRSTEVTTKNGVLSRGGGISMKSRRGHVTEFIEVEGGGRIR